MILLKHIIQLSKQLAETQDPEEVLNTAMNTTIEIIGAELCYLVLIGENGQPLVQAASPSMGTRDFDTDDLSQSILFEVINQKEPIVIVDALSDDHYSEKSSVLNLQCRSVMCVPLTTRGEVIGALYVENRTITGAFRQEDLEPLVLFSNHVAVAIENARIVSDLEHRVQKRTAELEHSWEAAVEANRLRTTLLGQLTHDMRNSLAVANLSLDMLSMPRTGDLNERQQTLVERTVYATEQITALVSDLFALSKAELQSLDIHPVETDMNLFLKQAEKIGVGLPWRDGVKFVSAIEDNLPILNVDPVRLQQVLMNLLSNAQKFALTGQVELYAHMKDEQLVIGVKDTGVGIPAEHLPHIFERFKQFDSDAKQQATGGGFGLAICKELVEKHGGRIWVESTPDVGSSFWLTI